MVLRLAFALQLTCLVALCGQERSTSGTPAAPSFADMQVLPLTFGPNHIDLNGDGKLDVVFIARRDNGNAHDFDVFTFYLATPGRPRLEDPQWLLVPLYDSTLVHEMESFRTSMGAECVLDDIRVLGSQVDPHAPVEVILGHHELGETFADSMPVTFVVYRFVYDSEGVAGWPPFYFRAVRTIHGRHRYCDINDAFMKELGLGPYGRAR